MVTGEITHRKQTWQRAHKHRHNSLSQKWDRCSPSYSKITATWEQQVWLEGRKGFSQSLAIPLFPIFFLLISCYIYWCCTWINANLSPLFLQHNEILNPVHSMPSDSILVFVLEAFPLTPADCSHLGSWSSQNTLDRPISEAGGEEMTLSCSKSIGGMYGGTTRSPEESVLKRQEDTVAVRKIYGVWCDWHGMLFVGSSLGRTSWHVCGRKPNQLWFTPPHHLAGGCPVTQPLQKMYCEV